MLEDFTVSMEKKPVRLGQGQGKSTGTESKKNQDVAGGKPFPRTRRRESTQASSSSSKSEPFRKPAPQKNKTIDKRPRPRGQYYGGGKEDPKVTAGEVAEYGSVFVPGSKKQNLNHLLNFHYAPRSSMVSQGSRTPSGWSRSQRWLPNTHKHKYNKEHFLQANCQFVVKANGDYTAYFSNPDMLVDWDLIEQIRVLSGENLSCPICLCVPVAGKMTRCGHVFCWPCILHYLALSDKTWRACPICYESVHKNDLKSVVGVQQQQVGVGDDVTLYLMCRERGSMIAAPVGQYSSRSTSRLLSISETGVDTVYSKLLTATADEVMCMLSCERAELETQLKEEQGCPELCFTEAALELLSQRHVELANRVTAAEPPTEPAAEAEDVSVHFADVSQSPCVTSRAAVVYKSAFDNITAEGDEIQEMLIPCDISSDLSEGDQLATSPTSEEEKDSFDERSFIPHADLIGQRQRNESASSSEGGPSVVSAEDLEIHHPNNPQKHFYFYQVSDGQHIYLHALNVRMLEKQYGSLAHCPPVIRGRIVEKEAGSMTEELRKRLRYLQHLSVTSQFEVAEIDLRPPTISKDTINYFQEQLDVRRRRRASRAKEERRREKKINEAENRKWGRGPAPRVHIQSKRHFPQWGADGPAQSHAQSLSPSVPSSPSVASLASRDSSPGPRAVSPIAAALDALELWPQVQEPSSSGGPSFAQMLRNGKSRGGVDWPAPKERPRVPAREVKASDSEPEPEGYVPAPTFSQSFSAAIALALEKAEVQQATDGVLPTSGKKKKNKKKILFATSMACSGK